MRRPLALAAAALLALSLVACGGSDDPEPAATTTTSSLPPRSERTPEPVDDEPEPEVDDEARAADLEAAMKSTLGVSAFSDLLTEDPTMWGGYVASVRVEADRAYVTLQVGSDEPGRDDLGERAASGLSRLLPASAVEDIGWIIVEDASGVVIAQEQPDPIV